MISNETDLKADVREQTGYTSTSVLSNDGLDAAYRTAQRHIREAKSLETDYDWYASENQSGLNALFWFTCLFCKRQTGELDAQNVQIGAIDFDHLDSEETSWGRDAEKALRAVKSGSIFTSASPARTDREYEPDSATRDGSGSGGSDFDI